jgi:GNAT superfamily N-acetyltransferase
MEGPPKPATLPASGLPRVERLNDGTAVRLRYLTRDDRDGLAAGFEQLSLESRYRRFFTAMPRLPDRMLDHLVDTDGWDHVAIAAEASAHGDKPEGFGVARFIRLRDAPDTAEIAIAVVDARQGQGLGRILLHALINAAADRGIAHARATVLPGNAAVQALLTELAPDVSAKPDQGYVVYDIPIAPHDSADEARGGLLFRLLKLAAGGIEFAFQALRVNAGP